MSKKIITLLALLPMLMPILCVRATDSIPSIEEITEHLPFQDADLEKLLAGEIVTYDLEPGSDKELSIIVGMLVKTSIDQLTDFVLKGQILRASKDVIAVHLLGDAPPNDALFSGVGFTANESNEVAELLQATPGSKLNLSNEEIERLNSVAQKVKSSGSADDSAVRDAMNDAYRAILMDRYKAFRNGGLSATAPYDRGEKNVNPGEELRGKVQGALLMKERMPNFHRALLNYPNDARNNIHNIFALVKQNINNRPAYILSRRMYQYHPGEFGLSVYQEYYVGHSYNSLQIIAAAFHVEQGTLVFYANRTSTDQVAGFGGGIKRSIGRGMLRDAVIDFFESVRRSVQ